MNDKLELLQSKLEPHFQTVQRIYDARQPREQLALKVLAVVVVGLLMFALIWMPAWQWRQEAKSQYEKYSQQLAWIEANRDALMAVGGSAPAAAIDGNWTSVIGKSAPLAGITLKSMNSDGSDAVNVQLENQLFDQTIAWLSKLYYQQGAIIDGIEITPGADSGRVNLRATLRRNL